MRLHALYTSKRGRYRASPRLVMQIALALEERRQMHERMAASVEKRRGRAAD
jgi:hypothetical protein